MYKHAQKSNNTEIKTPFISHLYNLIVENCNPLKLKLI
jgi:hypothetical protein